MTLSPKTELTPAQVRAYLERLGLDPSQPHSLRELHRAHLLSVPFENLDIHLGRPIQIDLDSVYRKVVEQRRGGYCYELNGLFAALLRALGDKVELLAGQIGRPDGTFVPEFNHLALRVQDGEQVYLADVGFGDAFLDPMPLESGTTRREGAKTLRLEQGGEYWTFAADQGEGFRPQYRLTLTPRTLADFEEKNVWQQTSPDSHFVKGRIVSIATPTGRLSLSGNRLIRTENGVKTEQHLEDSEIDAALAEHFGIHLEVNP